jgi:thiamine-phosphate pyrophosphorylase
LITCYITDREGIGGDTEALLACIERNAQAGVTMIQIREKDLGTRDLLTLTRRALRVSANTKILVNGRVDVALAAGAHGVHLPGNSIGPRRWRGIVPLGFQIGVSCHSLAEIEAAEGADFIVFSPVFDSPGKGAARGLEGLRNAVLAASVPVLALGGVTAENTESCLEAGAVGIAAIRLFQAC